MPIIDTAFPVDDKPFKAQKIVAIAGAPNTGKTTVFNNLTGAHQHVANFPGVTVETKAGRIKLGGKSAVIVDLPGTYSLTAFSQEELVARHFLLDRAPDVVVDVVDSGNLSRNLFLTVQLLELGLPIVLCLNMIDRAEADGISIDVKKMSELLGVPVIPMAARSGIGLGELKKALSGDEPIKKIAPLEVDYGHAANAEIEKLAALLASAPQYENRARARWAAVKLLEGDREVELAVKHHPLMEAVFGALEESRRKLRGVLGDNFEIGLTQRRYGYINGIVRQVLKVSTTEDHRSLTDKLDSFLTHPMAGIPIFLATMWLLFFAVFTLAEPMVAGIETGFAWLTAMLSGRLGGGMLESLLVDGMIGGVGAVLVFVPNIFLLFMGIAILEDSGYFARAAFIMERAMSRLGLPGKALVPILVGFGCNVPAIMATRVLEDRRDRILAILVIPMITCSARLPVYLLLIGAFFPAARAGTVLWGIYIASVLFTVLTAKLFRTLLFKGVASPMILELPPYLVPTFKSVLLHAWGNARQYIKKAFTFILAGAILVWYGISFPVTVTKADLAAATGAVESKYSAMIAAANADEAAALEEQMLAEIDAIELDAAQRNMAGSIAGRLGKAVEPAIQPLGFDWRIGVGLIGGILAKEVVISTMGVIFNVHAEEGADESLRSVLQSATLPDGAKAYTPLAIISLMLFVLLYIPCVAVLAVQRKELASAKWFLFAATYTTVLAYVFALLVYQGGKLLGFG